MSFHSILSENVEADRQPVPAAEPAFFADLNLDQVVKAITAGKQTYDLQPFFYTPLQDMDTIQYRQEVGQDLEDPQLLEAIKTFAEKMSRTHRYLKSVTQLHYPYHQAGWFVEAVLLYCDALNGLARDLASAKLRSRGLLAFREYLHAYLQAEHFITLQTETQQVKTALTNITYCVIIKGDRVTVREYQDESDYSVEVTELFARFKQGAVKDYSVHITAGSGMNHIEAAILDLVAKLHADVFAQLLTYYATHRDFLDETIRRFDREIQFYVAYGDYIAPLKRQGLRFCYPRVTTTSKAIYAEESFDIALAHQSLDSPTPVICNDFHLRHQERIFVVSGPNQGGKTTFARMFGQLHYLASLGYPIPGRAAQLWLYDRILTHFEKEEDIRNLRGKLQDDLVRVYAILEQATPDSIIIMNEIFNSTTLQDAIFLGRKIMEKIVRLDALCVCVTFIDELATLNHKTVSLVSTVHPEDPTIRTYKIVRQSANGLAYALSIAEKYRLTYAQLQERLAA